MYSRLRALRAKVRGFHVESLRMVRRIQKCHGERRMKLRLEKRLLGEHCRVHHVAYCLLRGTPYAKIEQKCDKHNPINFLKLRSILIEHSSHYVWAVNNVITEQLVTSILSGDEAALKKLIGGPR